MGIYFTIALRNLLQAKRRTLLLGSAIALVTFIHIGLQSVSNGYMDGLVRGVTAIASGHINLVGLSKYNMAHMYPFLKDPEIIKKTVTEALGNELVSMSDRNSTMGRMIGDKRSTYLFLQGIELKNEKNLRKVLRIVEEVDAQGNSKMMGSLDALEKPNNVILFKAQAHKLGVGLGDSLSFNTNTPGGTNIISLTVGAIVEDVGMVSQLFCFTSQKAVQNLMLVDDDVGSRIFIYLKDKDKAAESLDVLRVSLEKAGFKLTDYQNTSLFRRWGNLERQDWMGQKIDTTTWEGDISEAQIVINSIRGVSYVLLIILSIIIAVGIMNTIWISARERTSETGCIRAIGMSSKGVMLLFMLEAMMLGFLGALVGGLCAYLAVVGITALEIPIQNEAMRIILFADKVNLKIDISEVIAAVVAFSFITSLAALLPSIKAAKIQPIQAINHIQ